MPKKAIQIDRFFEKAALAVMLGLAYAAGGRVSVAPFSFFIAIFQTTVLVFLMIGLGNRLVRCPTKSAHQHWLCCFVAGFGLLAVSFSFFGVLQWLNRYSVSFIVILFWIAYRPWISTTLNLKIFKSPLYGIVLLTIFGLCVLRLAQPVGEECWGDVARYYGFMLRYFVRSHGIGDLSQQLIAYNLFPLQPGLVNAGISLFASELAAQSFNIGLMLILTFAIFAVLNGRKQACPGMPGLIALSFFASVNVLSFDLAPLHFRTQEIFWLGAAALFGVKYFEKNKPAIILMGLCFGMAMNSMYSSVLFVAIMMFLLCIASRWGIYPVSFLLKTSAIALLLSAFWYIRSFVLSGSLFAFSAIESQGIQNSEAFSFLRSAAEGLPLSVGPNWKQMIPFFFLVLIINFPMVLLGLTSPFMLLNAKLKAVKETKYISVIYSIGFVLFFIISYAVLVRSLAYGLQQRRYYYSVVLFPILGFALTIERLAAAYSKYRRRIFLGVGFVALLPLANYVFFGAHQLKFQVKSFFGYLTEAEYLARANTHAPLAETLNLVRSRIPSDEAILTNYADIAYFIENPIFNFESSQIACAELWGKTKEETLGLLKKNKIRWFLYSTQYWIPNSDSNKERGKLFWMFSSLFMPELAKHLSLAARIEKERYSVGLFKISWDEPVSSEVPHFLESLVATHEDLIKSDLGDWRKYRSALSKDRQPFASRYDARIMFSGEAPDYSKVLGTSSAPIKQLLLPTISLSLLENAPKKIHMEVFNDTGIKIAERILDPKESYGNWIVLKWDRPVRRVHLVSNLSLVKFVTFNDAIARGEG